MQIGLVFILLIGVSIEMSAAYPSSEFLQDERALEYLLSSNRFENADKRSIMYTGKEQRREAKEKYEEKCERKLLSKALGSLKHDRKQRWCPELTQWDSWVAATRNDPAPAKKKIFG